MNQRQIAKQLKRTVDSKGLKQKFLAEKVGIHRGTLNQYLNGKRSLGRPAFLNLLRELGLDEETLKAKAS